MVESSNEAQQYELILGVKVHSTSYQETCQSVITWAKASESRYVCATSVHGIMTAYDDPSFREILNEADLITPDGMPLVWTLRLKGHQSQQRVYGPTLTEKLLPLAEKHQIPVGFLGSRPEIIENLRQQILKNFPQVKIAYAFSPPFRPFTDAEDAAMTDQINKSGTRILFVGLGCPKQEIWMHRKKGNINVVMLGVGAAFDFIAGEKRQAPSWIQRIGMEWFYRLTKEPKRLWKRYFSIIPRFLLLISIELIKSKLSS